ncbi:hypothetical protein BH18ACI5_BH18ACI5_17670 [soil metagenome]
MIAPQDYRATEAFSNYYDFRLDGLDAMRGL